MSSQHMSQNNNERSKATNNTWGDPIVTQNTQRSDPESVSVRYCGARFPLLLSKSGYALFHVSSESGKPDCEVTERSRREHCVAKTNGSSSVNRIMRKRRKQSQQHQVTFNVTYLSTSTHEFSEQLFPSFTMMLFLSSFPRLKESAKHKQGQ